MTTVDKITDDEFNLLRSAGPTNTLLPASWWAEFLSLFMGKAYTSKEAKRLLQLYNARMEAEG